jgi:hypothetical protein
MPSTKRVDLDGLVGMPREAVMSSLKEAGLRAELVPSDMPAPLAMLFALRTPPRPVRGDRVRVITIGDRVLAFEVEKPASPATLRRRIDDLEERLASVEAAQEPRRGDAGDG